MQSLGLIIGIIEPVGMKNVAAMNAWTMPSQRMDTIKYAATELATILGKGSNSIINIVANAIATPIVLSAHVSVGSAKKGPPSIALTHSSATTLNTTRPRPNRTAIARVSAL